MLTYTNNSTGESITLSSKPYRLVNLDGLGGSDSDVQMQKSPFQDGATYIDTLLEPRYIEAEIVIFSDDIYRRRSEMSRILNPKTGLGILRYGHKNGMKEIVAKPETAPIFPSGSNNRANSFQRALVDFVCPNPFWRDINPTNIKLEDFVGNFSFPFSFPVNFAIRGDTRTLMNEGHVATPVTVTFVGEAVNPMITKLGTSEFIRVNRTIPSGYQLVITTEFNNKSVKIVAPDGVETNAMGYIDLESTFFSLDVGENRLSFITEGGQPEVYVEYRNWYVGV